MQKKLILISGFVLSVDASLETQGHFPGAFLLTQRTALGSTRMMLIVMLICYFFLNLKSGKQFPAICRGCILLAGSACQNPASHQVASASAHPGFCSRWREKGCLKSLVNVLVSFCLFVLCSFVLVPRATRYYSRRCVIMSIYLTKRSVHISRMSTRVAAFRALFSSMFKFED